MPKANCFGRNCDNYLMPSLPEATCLSDAVWSDVRNLKNPFSATTRKVPEPFKSSMTQLHRITTQYDPDEDRIRLTGVDDSGQTLILWLTLRLLNRLIPHLCQGLEKKGGKEGKRSSPAGQDLRSHVEQSFAQQKAKSELVRQKPVVPVAATPQWRVDAVDIKHGAGGAQLALKGVADAQQVTLALPTPSLRQWLGIMFDQYRRAGWPMHVWPAWMEEAAAPVHKASTGVLH